MSQTLNDKTTHASGSAQQWQGLVWNTDLTLHDEDNHAAIQRKQAIDQARASRPRTAQIEREIMIAVIVLYILILGSFAALHIYGEYALPTPETPAQHQAHLPATESETQP